MGFIAPGFDFFEMQSPYLELLAAAIGVCVGSFLNVLALRSLSGESLITPLSNCPKCKHRLGVLDLVPIVSYFCLAGRCRHCKEKISWHYPAVEALTACLFAGIAHHFARPIFEASPERAVTTVAMLIFTSVLVAVTVTDFKEKLIPHEITYPSIIIGLFYSGAVRHDLPGALAGVGVSYILFDFIAFYGLKIYYFMHPELRQDEGLTETAGDKASEKVLAKAADNKGKKTSAEASDKASVEAAAKSADNAVAAPPAGAPNQELDEEIDFDLDERLRIERIVEDEEPFEVMGGGDAVLSAVLAAWLGWGKLVVALVIGFMVGAIMGAGYLIQELIKEKRLNQLLRPAFIGLVVAGGLFALVIVGVASSFGQYEMLSNPTVWLIDLIVAFGGMTFGVIRSGETITKPFPFGPALAFGGIYAIFMINLADHTFIK